MKKYFLTLLILGLICVPHVHAQNSTFPTPPQNITCPALKANGDISYDPNSAWVQNNCTAYYNAQAGVSQSYCNSIPAGSLEWTNANCAQFTSEKQRICDSGILASDSPQWFQYGCDNVIRGPQTTPINNGASQTPQTATPVSSTNTCTTVKFSSLIDILVWIKCLITSLFIPLLFAAAFVFFLWGVIRFMTSSDATKKEESKKYIWYGLIGLFIMVSVWGIIKIAAGVFGFDAGIPYLPTQYLK